jgi:hypothetical protein
MSLYTLDVTTLYYWNISNDATSDGSNTTHFNFNRWANGIQPSSKSDRTSSRHLHTSRVPSLTHSTKTGTSGASAPTSNRSALAGNVAIKPGRTGVSATINVNDIGGLSDHEEIEGEEYETAKNSPVKGKKRVNSQVSSVTV